MCIYLHKSVPQNKKIYMYIYIYKCPSWQNILFRIVAHWKCIGRFNEASWTESAVFALSNWVKQQASNSKGREDWQQISMTCCSR